MVSIRLRIYFASLKYPILTNAHMANVRLDTSQQRLRTEVREMQEDLDLYFKFLDERMDRLVEALGIQDFE